MKLVCVAVWDVKAKAFMVPFYSTNSATAVRAFATAANTRGSAIGDNPDDFTLMLLGDFDDTTGQHDILGLQVTLAQGRNVIKEKQ